MEFKELGNTGVRVPVIGMGTWEIGGGISRDTAGDARDVQAIRKAIELGMTLIDTAEMYAAGHSEEIVGEAIKTVPREQLFIVTKIAPMNLHYDDVIGAAERSLKRLQVDWIDLYLVHHPNPQVPLKETMEAMEKLVEQSLVRFIGVSNFDANQMEEASSHLSGNEIVVNQVEYSVLHRSAERDVIPYCRQHQMTVMAHRPLARGVLSSNRFLHEIGEKYGKTAAQVALNWLIAREGVIAIPKAVNSDHLAQNAGAAGWKLSEDDLENISSHFHQ